MSGMSVLVVLAAGCAEELGPERWETVRVSGVVTEGKTPVERGWVEFLPSDGTVGNMRSAPLGPDGRFVVDGVAVGVNRVGISGAPIAIREVRRRFDPLGSPIRRTIAKGRSAPLKIDLLDEYALWLASRPAEN
jgi:hypothetical protein